MRLYQDKVYGLVYRMLGSQAEAEDVAQEVFVTVFKSIDSFRGDSKFSTWLYRIAANHCKNRIKYLRRRARTNRRRSWTMRRNGSSLVAGLPRVRLVSSTQVRSKRSKDFS